MTKIQELFLWAAEIVGQILNKTTRTKLVVTIVLCALLVPLGDQLLAVDARLSVILYVTCALVVMRYMDSQGAVDVEKAKKTS